ncbi:MAG: iron-sulfur cluster assembly scaffold protein [Proteobacteria bacterium]|nr:iron-sulfur cluster assembly scaffold protein [Pseudomonadota bacterium]
MEEKIKELLKHHSHRYIEMALRTDKRRRIANADGYGKRTGACGDTVEIFVQVGDGILQDICFETDGCLNTSACANTVISLSEGKPIENAWEIEADDIISYLETLPPEENHCAELAAGAFYLALSNYQEMKRAPWKKLYGS